MNPRNTASGSIKLLDSKEVARRPLECFLYSIVSDSLNTNKHSELLTLGRELGFNIPKHDRVYNTIDGVKDYIEYWDKERRIERPHEIHHMRQRKHLRKKGMECEHQNDRCTGGQKERTACLNNNNRSKF